MFRRIAVQRRTGAGACACAGAVVFSAKRFSQVCEILKEVNFEALPGMVQLREVRADVDLNLAPCAC